MDTLSKGDWLGQAVHGYRKYSRPDETITAVTAMGTHCYDGTQHETVVKAATDRHPRPRWYVGYGGDYIPAGKNDLPNIREEIIK